MKKTWLVSTVAAAALVAGCSSTPRDPNVERGPHGTIAYDCLIEASEPGARIEANGQVVGNTPLHLKIYGDKDGTFHDFGAYYYLIRAYPQATNQFTQVRYFGTGRHGTQEDIVPRHLYFDMNQPQPAEAQQPPVVYHEPRVIYYGPGPYYDPWFYGPRVNFYFRGGGGHHWH